LKRGAAQPSEESLQKRPRHTNPDRSITEYQSFGKGVVVSHNDKRATTSKNQLDHTRSVPLTETSDRTLERKLAGNSSSESDDPLAMSDDEFPSQAENDQGNHASIAALAKGSSLTKEVNKFYESDTNSLSNNDLPRIDMYQVKNSISKPTRIAGMKNQVGIVYHFQENSNFTSLEKVGKMQAHLQSPILGDLRIHCHIHLL
jgi:hypothetical protein